MITKQQERSNDIPNRISTYFSEKRQHRSCREFNLALMDPAGSIQSAEWSWFVWSLIFHLVFMICKFNDYHRAICKKDPLITIRNQEAAISQVSCSLGVSKHWWSVGDSLYFPAIRTGAGMKWTSFKHWTSLIFHLVFMICKFNDHHRTICNKDPLIAIKSIITQTWCRESDNFLMYERLL